MEAADALDHAAHVARAEGALIGGPIALSTSIDSRVRCPGRLATVRKLVVFDRPDMCLARFVLGCRGRFCALRSPRWRLRPRCQSNLELRGSLMNRFLVRALPIAHRGACGVRLSPARRLDSHPVRRQQLYLRSCRSGDELQRGERPRPHRRDERRESEWLESVRASSVGRRSRDLQAVHRRGRPRLRRVDIGAQRRFAARSLSEHQPGRLGSARQYRQPEMGRRGAAGLERRAAAATSRGRTRTSAFSTSTRTSSRITSTPASRRDPSSHRRPEHHRRPCCGEGRSAGTAAQRAALCIAGTGGAANPNSAVANRVQYGQNDQGQSE